jgi:hypothetical protein
VPADDPGNRLDHGERSSGGCAGDQEEMTFAQTRAGLEAK